MSLSSLLKDSSVARALDCIFLFHNFELGSTDTELPSVTSAANEPVVCIASVVYI